MMIKDVKKCLISLIVNTLSPFKIERMIYFYKVYIIQCAEV